MSEDRITKAHKLFDLDVDDKRFSFVVCEDGDNVQIIPLNGSVDDNINKIYRMICDLKNQFENFRLLETLNASDLGGS